MKALSASVLLAASVLAGVASVGAAAATCQGMPATIVGTNGDDLLVGTDGIDVIAGFDGHDEIIGGGGDDVLCGGPGQDVIRGGSGNDLISGGPGADTIFGESGDDTLRSGPGLDRIYGDFGDGSGGGADLIFGGPHRDVIWGAAGDDVIFGGTGPDEIFGQEGADQLRGTGGDDLLVGGPGDDVARGHKGVDECSAEVAACEHVIAEVVSATVGNDDGRLTISIDVSHPEAMAGVDVALRNQKLGAWLQLDETLGDRKAWHPTSLVGPSGVATTWETEVRVPRGHYTLSVRATDVDGDKGRLRPRPFFHVRVTGLEVGVIVSGDLFNFGELRPLPEGTALGRSPRDHWGNPVPAAGEGDTVRIGGAAYNGAASISYVEAAILNTNTGYWLQPDGSFAAAQARHQADCPHCIGTPTVFWLFDAELPDGSYEFHGYGLDYSQGDVADMVWPFVVDGSILETPQLTVEQADHTVFAGDPVAFSGTASDNIGVQRVEYSIRDRATGLWLCGKQPIIWEEGKCAFWADAASRNQPATDWSFELEIPLPQGRYRLSVAVFDELLHRNSIKPWLFFEVR